MNLVVQCFKADLSFYSSFVLSLSLVSHVALFCALSRLSLISLFLLSLSLGLDQHIRHHPHRPERLSGDYLTDVTHVPQMDIPQYTCAANTTHRLARTCASHDKHWKLPTRRSCLGKLPIILHIIAISTASWAVISASHSCCFCLFFPKIFQS